MKIEVKESTAELISGDSRTTGKPYAFRVQKLWGHMGKPYPVELTMRLRDAPSRPDGSRDLSKDQPPLPVGVYEVTDECYWVDRYGKLQVDLANLKPARAQVRSA